MKYGSVCSGIEAATAAWHPLGWEPAFFSEIEPFPCAVLQHHYPNVPNYGDMTRFKEWKREPIDALVGGTPCQSFSVAGLRKGMADPRGNLALVFLAIADRLRPRWVVWENVPGVLSSAEGRDFASFLGGLGQLGYGWAYRVLDAQYFGVPQRRRRVFVVGCLGDWRSAAAVLFERESLCGHPPPSRQAGERVAPTVEVRAGRSGETNFATSGGLVETAPPSPPEPRGGRDGNRLRSGRGGLIPSGGGFDVAPCLRSNPYNNSDPNMEAQMLVTHALKGEGHDASEDGTGRGTPIIGVNMQGNKGGAGVFKDLCPSLNGMHGHDVHAIAFDTTQVTSKANRSNPKAGDTGHPLAAGAHAPAVAMQEAQTGCREYDTAGSLRANGPGHDPVGTRVREGMSVRRLTPRECERLQGFPDDYTQVPYRGKPAADGPRYKALGNSMAVPVMRWIGDRIELVERMMQSEKRT